MTRVLGIVLSLFAASSLFAETRWFPESAPPASQLDVVDLREASQDTILSVITLQGHVNNAEATRLWVTLGGWEPFWLDVLKKDGAIERTQAVDWAACPALYASAYARVFVYDPAVPASINVATMRASLEQGIVAGPGNAADWAEGKEIIDLAGEWERDVDAYRWAFAHCWPKLNHRVLACFHPTSTSHMIRDYLVRHRVFHCWVSSSGKAGDSADPAAERAFLKALLAAAPPNIPVLGFWYSGADPGIDEYPGVGLAGEYGKISVPCDYATNLSVLSGVPVDVDGAVADWHGRLAKAPPPLEDKVYLCYAIVESGDAPSYLQNRQYKVWQDPKRGAIPINWSLGPGALELEATVAAHYYREATPNDCLYVALSGAGYCHPYRRFMTRTDDPEQAWADYLALTRRYVKRMCAPAVGLYTDAWFPFDRAKHDGVTRRFAEALPDCDALLLGMGRDGEMDGAEGQYRLGKGPLVSHVLTRWPEDYAQRSREENIAWLVEDIRAHTPAMRPAFMTVMALSWVFNPSEIVAVQDALGPDYVPLAIPAFTALYDEAHR